MSTRYYFTQLHFRLSFGGGGWGGGFVGKQDAGQAVGVEGYEYGCRSYCEPCYQLYAVEAIRNAA